MTEAGQNIWAGLTTAAPLDQANLVLGILGVWLMIRRSLWTFPIGLVAVTIQAVLFVRAKFYADAALQGLYFATYAWGWWHWVKDRGAAPELPVTRLSGRGRLTTLALATGATVAWALMLQRWTDDVMPWRDGFIAAFMVAAQVLQVRKNIENWPLWVVANAVAVVSYWRADLAYTAFLYTVYLGLAFAGWQAWRKSMRVPA